MESGKSRATRSTLDRLEEKPKDVTPEVVDDFRNLIDALFGKRSGFEGRIGVLLDDDLGFIADGSARRTGPLGPGVDSEILVREESLRLMIKGELDPRQALVFGGLSVRRGSVSMAMRFGDFLTGKPLVQAVKVVGTLPVATRDRDRAGWDLDEFGYALIDGALSQEELSRLRTRVLEQAAGERAAGKASIGESSQRIWNLINKGRAFHDLLLNPLIDAVVPERLGSHALLYGYVAQIALPGNVPSILHYDQICVQPKVPFPMGLNILWFLDEVSEANGGTRIVPGSHRADMAPDDPFATEGTIAAEGKAGTALLLDSRVWHSVGNNVTDNPRHVLASFFVRSYMRTQENYALSILPEVFETLDDKVRIMLGFRCTGSLGGVEGPMEGKMVRRPDSPVGALDASGLPR
ncbi:phytanoyl-CoA dioxygenase family protein [Sphingosinicella rhizophila]|uniref:Phytanoyl-CoA dioxygenase family protein n=1 Tax=Sphingosinicella rhizophila TaxID=3050082 RepID=A0ABU3QAQ8_9SPHN|nr:phytanoyl-CoA dioxygenase family protein [Sphingosinicella sp. GR2756]MDT9600491.1 phytanoyl-CoA dioxygenase family protein [Sphingosinicella sp. GR2756]